MLKSVLKLCFAAIAVNILFAAAFAGQPRVAVVVKTLTGDVFQLKMAEAARDKAIELGADATIYQAGGQTAVQRMVQIIEDLITQQVDVIVISPLDSKAVVPVFQQAKEEGVIIVCMDQVAEGDDYVTFISTDNYAAAALGAEFAKEQLGGKGKVLVVEGAPGSSVGDDRKNGFKDTIVKDSRIEVVGSQSGYWTNERAMAAMENMLQANPGVDLVFSCSDGMTGGILEAIKLAGKEGRIKVISFDGSSFGIELIKEGKIIADVAQFPIKIGQMAAEIGIGVFNGTVDPASLPKFIDSGTKLITAENADESLADAF
ncbi:MAG: sugar ABC transporter substrate-binding protein [Planctomycetota bacterium]|nr:sugar ABC transporter substrate-binding protein [Planctomycetota bacterium]